MNITEQLTKMNACQAAIQEHGKDETLQAAWNRCEHSDWMIWVLRRLPAHKEDKNLFVKIAIAAAKEVVHLSKDPQNRPQKAIEAAEAYLLNPCEKTQTLARHAAAYADAYAYAYAAASAAYADASAAAAYAASAAANAAAAYAYAASAAANAAAAYAAASAAAYAAASASAAADAAAYADAMKKKLVVIIRQIIPVINDKET